MPKIPSPKPEYLPSDDCPEPGMMYSGWHGECSDTSDPDRTGFTKPAPLEPIPEYPPLMSWRGILVALAVTAAAAGVSALFPWGIL